VKLHLFQQITELNRSFDQVAEGLQRLQQVPFFQSELIRHALSDVEIAACTPTESFSITSRRLSRMTPDGLTVFNANSVKGSRTGTISTSTSSEERRKRKGLAPRVVILPDWDMSDEDRFDEHQARRRTKAAAEKRRTQPQPKRMRR
jgi:hypothetical protein